jgi:hypothetical protein
MGTVAFKKGWNHRAVRTRPMLNAQGHDSSHRHKSQLLSVSLFVLDSFPMDGKAMIGA